MRILGKKSYPSRLIVKIVSNSDTWFNFFTPFNILPLKVVDILKIKMGHRILKLKSDLLYFIGY